MFLSESDIPSLPEKVEFDKNNVYDRQLKESYPINNSAYFMLTRGEKRENVGQIAEQVSHKYGVLYDEAYGDITSFFYALNKNYLLNIKHKNILQKFYHSLLNFATFRFKQAFESVTERRRFDFKTDSPSVWYILMFLLTHIFNCFKIHWVLMFLILGFNPYISWSYALFLTLNFIISIVVHEFSHILTLYALKGKKNLAFLGKSFATIGVYRRYMSPHKEIMISLSGPAVPVSIGLGLLLIGLFFSQLVLVLDAIVWIVHIMSLVTDDGRNAKKAFLEILHEKGEVA